MKTSSAFLYIRRILQIFCVAVCGLMLLYNSWADVLCPSNSTSNNDTCICDNGYTQTNNNFAFNSDTKVSNANKTNYTMQDDEYSYTVPLSGLIDGEDITITGQVLLYGANSLPTPAPDAGTNEGNKCFCRIIAPFETAWKYSNSTATSFSECAKKCIARINSNDVSSFYTILNNGEICEASSAPLECDDGQYMSNDQCQTCSSGYPHSTDGATSENDCYRDCVIGDVANATAVSGVYYYGGNSQCVTTACINGYHVESGICVENYHCDAGTYLPANETTCVECPAGSYCPGFTDEPYTGNEIGRDDCDIGTTSPAGSTGADACVLTCGDNEFKYTDPNTGTEECVEDKFQITTTNNTDRFAFHIGAAGTFYVDWGDGNTQKITKTALTDYTDVIHNYQTSGSYVIRLSGQATGYHTRTNADDGLLHGAVMFGYTSDRTHTEDKIARISGSLGAIFSTIGDGQTYDLSKQPRFMSVFSRSINLTGPIPQNLFNGVYGIPVEEMFWHTFTGCSGLTGPIPGNLFSGISGEPASSMFAYTFYGCTNLNGSIPGNLFSGISGKPAENMFSGTFNGCSGLTGPIPGNLFSGISGEPAENMFYATFAGCSGLTGPIPGNLFSGISGEPASSMFAYTFYGCTNLNGSIPGNLFSGISGKPASSMFYVTFGYCNKLSGSIPENLFSGISGEPASNMFAYTFYDCSDLTGFTNGTTTTSYIPADYMNQITDADYSTGPMDGMFVGTQLDESCPENTYRIVRAFDVDWLPKVSCTLCDTNTSGKYPNSDVATTDISQCYRACTIDDVNNATGVSGRYYYGDNNQCAAISCNDGYTADNGACVIQQYNINYSFNGGDFPVVAIVPDTFTIESDDIHLPVPVREGYEFNGWCDNVQLTQNCAIDKVIPAGSYTDVIVYARWMNTADLCFTHATYDNGECTCDKGYIESEDENIWQRVRAISADSYIDENIKYSYVIGTIYGNLTGESVGYTKGSPKTIPSADLSGGRGNGTNCFCRIVLPVETDWYYSGGQINNATDDDDFMAQCSQRCINKMVTENFLASDRLNIVAATNNSSMPPCVAQQYNINYTLNDGEWLPNTDIPTIFTIESNDIVLPVPVRENYEFIGWCDDEQLTQNCTDNKIISAGSIDDRNVYAAWKFVCYSETWLHIGENDKACLSETKLTSPAMAVKIGDNTYYLQTTDQTNINLNENSDKKLHISIDGKTYNVHDSSVSVKTE